MRSRDAPVLGVPSLNENIPRNNHLAFKLDRALAAVLGGVFYSPLRRGRRKERGKNRLLHDARSLFFFSFGLCNGDLQMEGAAFT